MKSDNEELYGTAPDRVDRVLRFVPISLFVLFAPACLAVIQANALADSLNCPLSSVVAPFIDWLNGLPRPLAAMLAGDYGVVAMFPFLLLYALPTILVFSALIAVYRSTGLIDRLSRSLHPLLRPFGLGGDDLVRVVMGFGCNVPAVISTRSCSTCSRGACVSAISFGSACSYQLPATLAVFAVVDQVWLGPVYLAVLAMTTLVYLWFTTPKVLRQATSLEVRKSTASLRLPDWRVVWDDAVGSLRDFAFTALPIFVVICIVAGLMQWSGFLAVLIGVLAPLMAVFHLPPESALSVMLGSIRKDGIAIGLLDSDWNSLKVPLETPFQILTVVYLAGVLLPCLVTVFTVAREMHLKFALRMVGRQAFFAALFSVCIAWFGRLLYSIT
ncbi:MAG: nucleoside recognition domain-containing protein [Opitutales bacterium]